MSTYGNRKKRQDFHDAVCDSPIFKNLPGYTAKYFALDLKRLDMDSFQVWIGARLIREKIGQNEIMQAKSIYHLFRNGLVVGRYKEPKTGGQAIGREYTREVPTSGLTARSEINQEIRKLCGSVSRPKNLYKLYEKIPMKAYTHLQESVHTNAKKDNKAYTQMQESVHTSVPKTGTSFDLKRTNLNRSSPKSEKKDPDYLKILKNKKPNEPASADDLKQVCVSASRFEQFGQRHYKDLAPLLEMGVTCETLGRAAMAFKRAQRKNNLKGPWGVGELYKLIEAVKYQHAVIQKPLN
ncbi:hypothetical protein ES703_50189 [subsurface metagenome]